MHRIDHLIYAAPDLARMVDDLEALLGVRAALGGRHPAWAWLGKILGDLGLALEVGEGPAPRLIARISRRGGSWNSPSRSPIRWGSERMREPRDQLEKE